MTTEIVILEESMSEKYCLIRDDSFHWYLCPHDQKSEANDIFDRIEDGEEIDEPDFVERIEGPHLLTFTEPKEES